MDRPKRLTHAATESLWGQLQPLWGSSDPQARPQRAREAQQAKLLNILAANAATAYGQTYHFEKLHTVADFQRAVPLTTAERLRPFIERSAQPDQPPQLTAEPPLFYAHSGGASVAPSRVPVTRAFIDDYTTAFQVYVSCFLGDHTRQHTGKLLFWSGNDAAGVLPNGAPTGALSGFLAHRQPTVVKRLSALPPELGRLTNLDLKHYLALRLALEQDISAILLPHTDILCQLAEGLARWSDDLIADIRTGSLQRRYSLPPALRSVVIPRLRPNPRRADELAGQRRENRGVLLPQQVWPKLSAIACWKGGTLRLAHHRLSGLFGPVPIREHGYLSAEVWGSVPRRDDQPGGVLALSSAFFEFLPESELESLNLGNAVTFTAEQLEVGRCYGLIVTTTAGLYRFLTSDVVRVIDFYHDAPVIAFDRRWEHVCSLAGERLTEPQVTAALLLASSHAGIELSGATAAPRLDPPGYSVTVEYAAPPAGDSSTALREELDNALRAQNVNYATARQIGTLGPLTLRRAAPGAFGQAYQERVSAGAPDGQIVLPHLSPNSQFSGSLAAQETIGERTEGVPP